MKTRKAKLSDTRELSILFDSYRCFYGAEPDLEAAFSFIHNRIRKNESMLFVCESSDLKLIGFAQLYPCFSSEKMQRLWTLNDLYVREECRGRGVARKLIQQCQRFCKNNGIYANNKETVHRAYDEALANNLTDTVDGLSQAMSAYHDDYANDKVQSSA